MSGTEVDGEVVRRLRPDRTECLEALLIGAGPHLVPVVDVGTAANGDLLVVLPTPAVRLPQLLAGGPTAGEAITVLVPLAQALQRLHAAGVAHGSIAADAVQLDADGSPSWTAPVEPTLLRRVGPAAFEERAAEDVSAFRALGAVLLGPVGLAVPEGVDLVALAVALFALAPAEPVRLRPVIPVPGAPLGPPSRLVPAAALPEQAVAPPVTGVGARALGAIGGLRTVRTRVWAALGGVAVLLVAAAVLLPAGEEAPAASLPRPVRSAAPSAAPPSVRPLPRTASGREAIPALLAERDRCLAAGSEACLRRVDAAGSPVLEADLDAVRAGSPAVRIDRTRLRLPSGDGATALATAGGATVLAVREQNGWRLRDVVAEPPKG
ncbi:hypothetical protein GCM10025783_14580 [Amnibacterium soli]|uniref:Protein kinase domain-containing protein n=1 Tax=Amnibacterium soli TaxID=1282736 RepID=A0ABP8Z1P3_9MICO